MVKSLPSKAGGVGLIPSWGAKTPHTWGPKNQNMKQKQYCIDKSDKDFKNGPHKESLKKKKKQREGKDVECVPDNIFKSPTLIY